MPPVFERWVDSIPSYFLEMARRLRFIPEGSLVGTHRALQHKPATGPAQRYGVTGELHSTPAYGTTQGWAAALLNAGFDGVRNFCGQDPSLREIGIALFGDAGGFRPPRPSSGLRYCILAQGANSPGSGNWSGSESGVPGSKEERSAPNYLPPPCVEGDEEFADVPFDSTFCPWIEELFHREVISGCGDGNYCPTAPVTRAQMSIFLLKSLEGGDYSPPECSSIFSDVDCPSLFGDWIEDLFNRGITGGCSVDPALYCPGGMVTRGQIAALMVKTFELALYGP